MDAIAGPRYPEVTVELVGQDSNAFNLLGLTQRALRKSGVPEEKISEFFSEATAGSYDELLQTIMRWVEVS
jgi:hypothetical protein